MRDVTQHNLGLAQIYDTKFGDKLSQTHRDANPRAWFTADFERYCLFNMTVPIFEGMSRENTWLPEVDAKISVTVAFECLVRFLPRDAMLARY